MADVINTNTTWTPEIYNLTGNVTIANGATLSIDSGVVVNVNYPYQIVVNGTLIARGTTAKPILFNSHGKGNGGITFTQFSTKWDKQTGSGSIIDHASTSRYTVGAGFVWIQVSTASPMISNNYLGGIAIFGVHQ